MTIKSPKKLIEVALPLDAINVAAAREKSIRHGHPSTLHLWWARRPLAAARAVIFAQMVNDPGYERELGRGMNKEKAAIERERLFRIIEKLVLWENTNNEAVLREAREEIWKSWRETCALNRNHPQATELFNPDKLPAFHDPFAGGGALPLEAQRLGLESYASDLNPVAVTINKAMIEIPPKFAGRPPVGPVPPGEKQIKLHEEWAGAMGLAEDVRRYGAWMRAEAEKCIGHLYPQIEVTAAMVAERPDLVPYLGQKLTVIAWLWARTVKSPNPAFSHIDVPLVTSFVLSSMAGKGAYVDPVVTGDNYRFTVKAGNPPSSSEKGTKPSGRGSTFECVLSGSPIDGKYIKLEGQSGRIGARLMAIIAEGVRGRVYLSPTDEHEMIIEKIVPVWRPEQDLVGKSADQLPLYGMKQYWQLFTPRQLFSLTTFTDLIQEAIKCCRFDSIKAGIPDDGITLESGGTGATAYAEAVGVYLALAISRFADRNNALCTWDSGPTGTRSSTGGSSRTASLRNLFSRQAIQMAWDYGEANPFSNSGGSYNSAFDWIEPAVQKLYSAGFGRSVMGDAQTQSISERKIISTDPPYYDNIGYADLSDFFYVWLRRSLRAVFPNIFATLVVPKSEELVATAYRHGSREKAESFFLDGMTSAMHNLAKQAHPAFPVTIYYAFKQAETKGDGGTSSTGWETFLAAVLRAGFAITGTWPMRTELGNRMIGSGTNALASSIILVCQKRASHASTISRREFIRELDAVLPVALDEMTSGGINSPVAPVDLSQAIIGPGMAIFSRYAAVLEADGKPMTVKAALQLINRFLSEDDFDHDTQFCLHWFESLGWAEGKYGEADVLARAKGTSVGGLTEAGVVESGAGKLRLLRWVELPADWDPDTDTRIPIWEALHHLIRALSQQGESAAGVLLARMPSRAEAIRSLAYRLYTLCERKGWAEEARAYNELITSWEGVEKSSHDVGHVGKQETLEF